MKKGIIPFVILTSLLASCGQQERDITEAKTEISNVDVYVDIVPQNAQKDQNGNINIDSIHVGTYKENEIPDNASIRQKALENFGSQGVQAQQIGFVELCTRTVAWPHISRTQAVRGQVIVKGTITCPPTPNFSYSANATMTLQKTSNTIIPFFQDISSNRVNLTTSRVNTVTVPDYNYFAYASCVNGLYRGKSDIIYYNAPQGPIVATAKYGGENTISGCS
jgi:hypothetical protein